MGSDADSGPWTARLILAVVLAAGCAPDATERNGWTAIVDTLPDGTAHVVNTPPDGNPEPTLVAVEGPRIGSTSESRRWSTTASCGRWSWTMRMSSTCCAHG